MSEQQFTCVGCGDEFVAAEMMQHAGASPTDCVTFCEACFEEMTALFDAFGLDVEDPATYAR